jgi:hypothetical protein
MSWSNMIFSAVAKSIHGKINQEQGTFETTTKRTLAVRTGFHEIRQVPLTCLERTLAQRAAKQLVPEPGFCQS